MSKRLGQNWIEQRLRDRATSTWEKWANAAQKMSLRQLLQMRADVAKLESTVSRVKAAATANIARHMGSQSELKTMRGADWAWRPEVFYQKGCVTPEIDPPAGKSLGSHLTLHHDAKQPNLVVRQSAALNPSDVVPYGFILEIYDFEGSFLSLAIDLPESAIAGLSNQNIFDLALTLRVENPTPIYARINVKHGPNVDQDIKEIKHHHGELNMEFDLGYMDLHEKRLEKVWVDLIFDQANMNKIEIQDLTVCRRMRAQF